MGWVLGIILIDDRVETFNVRIGKLPPLENENRRSPAAENPAFRRAAAQNASAVARWPRL